jgi:hypothetical protein
MYYVELNSKILGFLFSYDIAYKPMAKQQLKVVKYVEEKMREKRGSQPIPPNTVKIIEGNE